MANRTWVVVLCLALLAATVGACAAPTPTTPQSTSAPATSKDAAASGAAQPSKPAEAAKPAAKSEPITVKHSSLQIASNLDPAFAYGFQYSMFDQNVYEGLVETVPQGAETRPLLAKEWTISPDRTVYTFKLRDDVVFHDGTPFDAEAVKIGYDRIKARNQGRAYLMSYVKSYAVKDKYTLEITLANPYPYFLEVVSRFSIVSPKAIADNKAADDPWAAKWFTTNEAGTGPYKMAQYQPNSTIELTKFDKYYRKWEPGTPERVFLRQFPDANAAILEMQRGGVDIASAIPADLSERASTIPGIKIVEQRQQFLRGIWLNTQRKPLDDKRVRQAIQMAYNYQAEIDFTKGNVLTPSGPLAIGFPGADPSLKPFKQDLNKARQLLAEAGYPNGGFSITYSGTKGFDVQEFAGNNLQDSLKPLGIEVKQQLVANAQLAEMRRKLETATDSTFFQTSPAYGDPNAIFQQIYHSKGPENVAFLKDLELDAMIEKVNTIADEKERTKVLFDMQNRLVDLAPTIWVSQPLYKDPVRTNLDNVKYETLNGILPIRFFYVRVKS